MKPNSPSVALSGVVTLCLILGLSPGVSAEEGSQAGPALALEAMIPADATLVVLVPDATALLDDWRETPFGGLWEDPAARKFLGPFREMIEVDSWDESLKDETGYDFEELFAMLSGQVAFFLADFPVENDDFQIGFLAMLDDPDTVGELLLRKWEEADEDRDDSELFNETEEFRGVEMHLEKRLSSDQESEDEDHGGWAVVNDILVAGAHSLLIEELIASVLDGGIDEPITDTAGFQSVQSQITDSDLLVYLNMEHVVALMLAEAEEEYAQSEEEGPSDPDPRTVFDALGFDVLEAAFLTAEMNSSGVRVDLGITYGLEKGLAKVLAYRPDPPQPAFIPADAEGFAVVRFDFQGAWAALEETMNAIDPSLLALGATRLAALTQASGVELDLRSGLLETLGDEVVSVQRPAGDAPNDGPPFFGQDQVFGIAITGRQGLELTLETIKGLAGQGSELFEAREYVGNTIYTLKNRSAEGAGGAGNIGFSYALTDSYLFLSLGDPAILEDILVRLSRPTKSVWSRPEVSSALAQLPPGYCAVSYQGATSEFLSFLLEAIFVAETEDPVEVPSSEVFAKHFGPLMIAAYKDSNSFVVRLMLLDAALVGGDSE